MLRLCALLGKPPCCQKPHLPSTAAIGNILLCSLWLLWLLLLWYTSTSASALKPFDPYEILGVEVGAAIGDIKKAYRQLSLKYHPDKVCAGRPASQPAS